MKKWLKILLWVMAAIIALIIIINIPGIVRLFKRKKAPVKQSLPPADGTAKKLGTPNTDGTKVGTTSTSLDGSMVLAMGSQGAEVKELQHLLNNANPNESIMEDGIFGTLTQQSLEDVYGADHITLNQAWASFTTNSATGGYTWSSVTGNLTT